MAIPVFDTHAQYSNLISAGFTPDQAEAVVAVVDVSHPEALAPKSEIEALRTATKREVQNSNPCLVDGFSTTASVGGIAMFR